MTPADKLAAAVNDWDAARQNQDPADDPWGDPAAATRRAYSQMVDAAWNFIVWDRTQRHDF